MSDLAFYDALAPLFDVMTDWEARLAAEGPFLRAILAEVGAHSVLDVACGSGGHALALARWGYATAGVDASSPMVALARSKAARAGLEVPFAVAELAGLPEQFGEQKWDAVLCLGNSLPHLLTDEDLIGALRGMAAVMSPGGLLLLQNLNYDLRWQTQPRFFLPQGGSLNGQEVLVWRFADYDVTAGRIAFHVALFRKAPKAGWTVEVHTTPQRPLLKAAIEQSLAAVGFEAARAYGQMTLPAPPFDPASSGIL